MNQFTRRDFLKTSLASGLMISAPRLSFGAGSPNSDVRIAVVGLGGIDVPGSVGGRGRQLIARLRETPGAKIVALCDVDKAVLDHGVKLFKDKGEDVAAHSDLRRVLDDKNIDAIVVATPNHWHALATVWGCQAGKDVYVEKPVSYDIWEGRQMVAAARKYNRVVQTGTQRRSSGVLPQAFEFLRSGQIGAARCGYTLVYRVRPSLGKLAGPIPVPATVDYDLWCGPLPKGPVMRKQFHYEWHWSWLTGNGEMANNGTHVIDICRWGLGQTQMPPRAISIGARLAFDDYAETPNTHIVMLDYQPVPIICEIRNVETTKGAIGKFRNKAGGIIIDCEGGYLAGDFTGVEIFDKQGKKIKEFKDGLKPAQIENKHLANFIDAVRSRKADSLNADVFVGAVSAGCCHMANVSHRLGKQMPAGQIQEAIKSNSSMADSFERCRAYLNENKIDIESKPLTLGPWVTFDSKKECFVGEHASEANAMSKRNYRSGFAVPELA